MPGEAAHVTEIFVREARQRQKSRARKEAETEACHFGLPWPERRIGATWRKRIVDRRAQI